MNDMVNNLAPVANGLGRLPLGRTGMQISRVGFGAWALGGGDWAVGWGRQDDARLDRRNPPRRRAGASTGSTPLPSMASAAPSGWSARRCGRSRQASGLSCSRNAAWCGTTRSRTAAAAGRQPAQHPARGRGVAAAARRRAHRSLPGALAFAGRHTAGGILAGHARPEARREGRARSGCRTMMRGSSPARRRSAMSIRCSRRSRPSIVLPPPRSCPGARRTTPA